MAPAPPQLPLVTTAVVPILLREALGFLDGARRPDLALAVVERILAADPDNAAALIVAGLCADRLDEPDEAVSLFDRAIAAMPSDPTPRRLKAAVLLGRGRGEDAVALLTEAAALAPDDYETQVALGAAHRDTGRPDLAADAFRAAAAVDPSAAGALKNLILADLESGRLDAAAESYRTLLRLDGQEPLAHLVVAGRLATIAAWCAERGARYETVAPACPDLLHAPRYLGEPIPEPLAVTRPETYVAEIPDATVIGGETLVVVPDGRILFDIACRPGADRFDLAERVTRYASAGVTLIDAAVSAEEPIEAAIAMAGVSSFNYYHWLIEFVARSAVIETSGRAAELADLPLLVDRAVLGVPQLLEALLIVAGPGRSLIPLEAGVARRVKRLVVPSQLAWMPNNLRDGENLLLDDYYASSEAIQFLHERLSGSRLGTGSSTAPSAGGRRIYLAKVGGSRRLLNGPELEPVLAEFGIEIVKPESLRLKEQIALFAAADLVVAESGAALTNLLYCRPGTRVVVFMGDRWDAAPYSQIAGVLGLSMVFVTGTLRAGHSKVYQSPFTLDPEDLARALAQDAAVEPVP